MEDSYKTLLLEQNKLLEAVLELTGAQSALIAEDPTDTLLENIAKRQGLIDSLALIQKELEALDAPEPDVELEELKAREQSLLEKIREQDLRNERLALERMDELRGKMRKNRDGLAAAKGYDADGDIGAVYFNKLK